MPRSKGSQNNADGKNSSTKAKRRPSSSAGHDCNICRKSNMTLSGLKIHLLTHSGEKPYTCTECDKRFTCSSNLKKHQRIHTRDYIYECDVCGKTCSDPSNMKKHMTVHSDEKAYTCPSCGKSYSYAQSLRQHMDDVHVGNGERRRKNKKKGHFPCPECGKVFGYYWRCSLHQARVHAVEKPYKCPECGKAFARETILNKHIQTHEKPFSCTECERRFSFRDQLRKHMRTHTGEKPYSCEQCFRSFTQRGSLTEHMRTHTGEKPFACTNCGQKFSSSSSLKRHQKRVFACPSRSQGEEFPLNKGPRRMIYVNTPPVTKVRVATSTSTQSLVMENQDVLTSSAVLPTEESYDTEDYQPPMLTSTGRITMVPAGFQPSVHVENSSMIISSEDLKPPFRQIGRNTVATSNFQPQVCPDIGQIAMVSTNAAYLVPVGKTIPMATGSQQSNLTENPGSAVQEKYILATSPALAVEDVKPKLILDESITVQPTEDVKPSITNQGVSLNNGDVKSLVSMADVIIPPSNFQPLTPIKYPSVMTTDGIKQHSPENSSFTSSSGTKLPESTELVNTAISNDQPTSAVEYPSVNIVTEDVYPVIGIKHPVIAAAAPPPLLSTKNATIISSALVTV